MYCERCGQQGDWVEPSPVAGKPWHLYDQNPVDIYGYHPDNLCQGCHTTLSENIILTSDISFKFYYSAASYTSREVLKQHEEDNVLVSYRTQENGRLGTETTHFVDCGGDPGAFRHIDSDTPEYPSSHESYLNYVENTAINSTDKWALRDYPCDEGIIDQFNTSVKQLQQQTRDAHIELLNKAADRGITAQPVSILQGTTIDEYLQHAITLRDHDALTDYVAIGGLVGYGPKRKQQIILAVREFLPERHRLHGLGVNLQTLKKNRVLSALTSADTGYWYNRDAYANHSPEWGYETHNRVNNDTVTYQYLDHRRKKNTLLSERLWAANPDELGPKDTSPAEDNEQQTLSDLSKSEATESGNENPTSNNTESTPQIDRNYKRWLSGNAKQAVRQANSKTDTKHPQETSQTDNTQKTLNTD